MSTSYRLPPDESISTASIPDSSYVSFRSKPSEEYIETAIILPPDGGWGWMVVFGSFLCHFVLDGATYTFGVFLGDISKTFNTQKTTVSLASSIMTGFLYITGPISCAIVNRLGFQATGFIGGVIASIAFACSTVTTSVEGFLAIFGTLVGFGFCAVFVPSIIVIGFYFEKWRALATSIAVTGSAAGIVCFPIIMDFFLKEYSWQNKFQILSGLCLVTGFLCLLYRPIKPTKVLTTKDKEVVQLLSQVSGDDSFFHLAGGSAHRSDKLKRFFKRFHNAAYPTHSQLCRDSTFVMAFPVGPSASSVFLTSVPGSSITTFLKMSGSKADARSERLEKLSTVYENDSIKVKTKCRRCWRKCCCDNKCCDWCCGASGYNRPMYRDDIFFSHSLNVLPQYAQLKVSSNVKSTEYTMSVTRTSILKGQEERIFCKCCPESIVRTIATMLSFHLLKLPSFLCLALSGFFTVMGMYTPFIYLVERAEENGISEDMSVHLFTALGVSNGVGRIASGMIASIPQIEPLMVSYISLFICGVSTLVSYFLVSITWQFIYVTIFGLTIACFSALKSCIIVDLLGLENLTNAFGLLLLFSGFAAFIGIPLAGKVVELTDSFNKSFIYAGCMLIISAILLMPMKRISKWEKSK